MKTISSGQTLYFKLFPVLWGSIFGLGTILFWLEAFRGKDNELPPEGVKYLFTAAWTLGTTTSWWLCAGLKRVRIDGTHLYVSNYLEEESAMNGPSNGRSKIAARLHRNSDVRVLSADSCRRG